MVQVRQTLSIVDAWARLQFWFWRIPRGRVGVIGLFELDLASISVHLEVCGR